MCSEMGCDVGRPLSEEECCWMRYWLGPGAHTRTNKGFLQCYFVRQWMFHTHGEFAELGVKRSTLHSVVLGRVFLNTMRCSLRTGKELPCAPARLRVLVTRSSVSPRTFCPCGLARFPLGHLSSRGLARARRRGRGAAVAAFPGMGRAHCGLGCAHFGLGRTRLFHHTTSTVLTSARSERSGERPCLLGDFGPVALVANWPCHRETVVFLVWGLRCSMVEVLVGLAY